ncbi:MAG TPA: hypothetical protein VFS67_19960 [Polyangiaceae bacterium]|nr:hypothetical protein [Polyangiaceae bacterium]
MSAVITALPEEAFWLRRQLRGLRRLSGVACDVVTGQLGTLPLVQAVTGDGPHNAAAGLSALLQALPVRELIVAGVSGALDQELQLRTLLVGEQVFDEGGRVLGASESLLAAARRATSARPAVLLSAQQIADSAREKQRLRQLIQPCARPAAVDLESAAYASLAHAAGIPWLALRAVSDTADEALPAILNRCRDARGGVSRARVAFGVLADPGALPALLALRQRIRSLSALLGRAAGAVLLAGCAGAPPG